LLVSRYRTHISGAGSQFDSFQRKPSSGLQVAIDFLPGELPLEWGMPEPEGKKKTEENRSEYELKHLLLREGL
jgi:hypothetical protein